MAPHAWTHRVAAFFGVGISPDQQADDRPERHAASHPAPAPPRPLPPSPSGAPRWVAYDPRLLRRGAVTVLILISVWLAATWVFYAISHFLFLLLLSWLLAIAMEPAIGCLMKRGLSRGVSTTVTGVLGLASVVTLVAVFGTEFVNQAVQLVTSLPDLVTSAVDWVNSTFHTSFDASQIASQLEISPTQVAEIAQNLAGGLLGVVGSVVAVLFDSLTVLVFAFYFAAAGPRLLAALAVWLPPDNQRVMGTVWEIAAAKTGGYVVSKLVLAGLSSLFHGVFFWAIGLPSWLPMALLVGITAQFIPMIGTYIGIAVPVVLALFDDPIDAVWIIIFATIYQQIETYVFTPRVSRRTMDVHPVIALGAVFVGAAIWGPIGAIIGIPIAAAVVAIAQTYVRRYDVDEDVVAAVDQPPSEPA